MNVFIAATYIGIGIASLWILVYMLCRLGQFTYAQIHDYRADEENLLIGILARLAGYKYSGHEFLIYYDKSGHRTDGVELLVKWALATSMTPVILVAVYDLFASF